MTRTTGTYIFFGLLTFLGAAFIWFYVPETKCLTLEEMDIIFGSSGVAVADQERMRAINAEIGLDQLLRGGDSGEKGMSGATEKAGRTNSGEISE